MKALRLSLNPGVLLGLLSRYVTGEMLPPNMVGILRSKSTVPAGWKSFATSTDVGSWEDSVRGHLTHLDEDW